MKNILLSAFVLAGLGCRMQSVPADPPDLGASADLGVPRDFSAPSDFGAPFMCDMDEFYEGSVTFPDGAMHYACSRAWSDGISMSFADAFSCRVLQAGGTGGSVEASWFVGADGEWFNSVGPKDLQLLYQPNSTLHPSFCPSDPLHCGFRGVCRFEVTRAAGAVGDMIEGYLSTPCIIRYSATGPAPTLTAMRFRAHLSARNVNDAGATCSYP